MIDPGSASTGPAGAHNRIRADTALRLSRSFDMGQQFCMHLQGHYDMEVEEDKLATTS